MAEIKFNVPDEKLLALAKSMGYADMDDDVEAQVTFVKQVLVKSVRDRYRQYHLEREMETRRSSGEFEL